jgi:glutathione peroxidase
MACLASAAPGTFYALSTKTLGDDLPYGLCNLKGKVVLVVNTASFCGYTPQLETLEPLYQAKRASGLVVAGFPSQSFQQEFDSGAEAKDFCSKRGVTFPMFELGDVKGPNIIPVFSWLTTQPVSPGEIQWNFEKFLISRKGTLIARFATATDPTDPTLVAAIDAALAESP